MEDATEKNGRPYGKSVYNFDELSVYLTTNAYPDWCKGKRGLKSNFRTKASKFKIVNAELVYLHKVSRKTSEEDDDIVTTTSTTSTLRFTPTDSNWRNHAAHKLGLPIRKGRFTSRMASTIGEPRIIDHILGDGNCLFRALSKEVTGTEKHHMTVRNKVVSVLENPSHTKNFESYSGHADMTEYVSKSRMGDNATWATDIEILAAASLLDTPIVIHTQLSTGKKWLKYDPLCVVPPVVDTELCIYLTNYHEHFNRVVSISK